MRIRLLRWAAWFAAVNAAGLAIVGLPYIWHYSPLTPWLGWLYAVLAYVGHLTSLAYVPFLVVLAPVTLLLPRPRLVMPLAVLLASAGLSILLIDSLVFAQNRYHLNGLTLALLAPQTWAFVAFYLLMFLAIETLLALWVWRRCARPARRRTGLYLALGAGGCLLASQVIHAWAEARFYVPVTSFTHYLPLYHPLKDRWLQTKLGLIHPDREREHSLLAGMARTPGGVLSYPLAPLTCRAPSPPLNVLLVVIDAMRADTLTRAVAPRLSEFAEGAARFERHYSGGNSSRAGMFSLFYGIPATYWDAFADLSQPPVLMDLFRQHGYQLGLFVSTPVYRGVGLERTALARVPTLRFRTAAPSSRSHAKDLVLTDDWLAWLDRRDPARPFFGFLYYDTAQTKHPPDDYRPPITVPAAGMKNAHRYAPYLTSVHYVDSLVGRVLDDLQRRQLLERTVVIVTSDHGEDFDESGQGFIGHGTSYSRYQMHTPLVVRWPGRPPGRVERRTSHNDVAPTLLTRVFGCTNPPSDYASGEDLFAEGQWDWLLASSYTEFALIEPDRTTIVFPAGYEIRDADYRLVRNPTLARDVLRAAMHEMSRFYR